MQCLQRRWRSDLPHSTVNEKRSHIANRFISRSEWCRYMWPVPDMWFSHSIHCKLYTIISASCTASRIRFSCTKVFHLLANEPYECTTSTDVIMWLFGILFTLPLLFGCWSCDHLNSVHATPYEAHGVSSCFIRISNPWTKRIRTISLNNGFASGAASLSMYGNWMQSTSRTLPNSWLTWVAP